MEVKRIQQMEETDVLTAGVNAAGNAMEASENQAIPQAITRLPVHVKSISPRLLSGQTSRRAHI